MFCSCALVSRVNHIPRTDQNVVKEEIGGIPEQKQNCLFPKESNSGRKGKIKGDKEGRDPSWNGVWERGEDTVVVKVGGW